MRWRGPKSGHRATRSGWISRLWLLACVVAFLGLPILLYRLEGGFPSLPRWATWTAFRGFLHVTDDVALTNAILRDGERLVWALWAYFLLAVLGEIVGRIAERLGRPRFRAVWERIQPRSALAAANFVVTLALTAAPRFGQGSVVAAAPAAATVPQNPAPGAGGGPPVAIVQLTGFRQDQAHPPASSRHVVRHGETLWGIATQECGTPLFWRSIAELNNIDDPERIFAGTVLELPPACRDGYMTYVVEPGDSLAKIAQREYGRATAATGIWEANRDAVMRDGRRFTNPNDIFPEWVLRLPTNVGSVVAPVAPPAPPTQVPPVSAQPSPEPPATPAEAPAADGTAGQGAGAHVAVSPSAVPRPSVAPGTFVRHGAIRPAPAPQGKTQGVRVPGGWLPYGLASGLAGVAYLATLRRWSRRRLAEPERRRPMSPVVGALSGTDRVLDAITPHTLALLEVFQAGREGPMPRVLGAWEAERGVAFLLDCDPDDLPPGGVDRAKTFRVDFGERDGKAVGVTTALVEPETCLRREVVPFIDELLVPVGRRVGEGWLHVPLLNEPISVVGLAAHQAVWSMVMAAAVRTGDLDLRISVAGELLGEARLPDGVELPGMEIVPAGDLGGLPSSLAEEARERATRIQQDGFETFADLQTLWPASISAWVLVLDPDTATKCAPQLAELASMGVGAIVLGEWPAARRLVADAGRMSLTAPGVGSVEGLEPVALDPRVVDELEEVAHDPGVEEALEAAGAGPPEDPTGDGFDVEIELAPNAPPARFCLYVLGGFRATRGGEEIPMTATSSALARELVARLAVAGTEPVPARALREDLWPDELDPEVNKGQPLYQLVSRARSWLLGVGGAKEEVIEYLKPRAQHEGGSYRLRGVWVDLVAFRQAAAHVSRGGLEEALRLYAGELLAGQESDRHFRWVSTGDFRDAERFSFYRAVASLAAGLLADGDPDQALTVLDRALACREGAAIEELARLAMRCEAAKGNADAIRRRYGRLCAALERDEASGETSRLCKDLLASLDVPAARPRPPAVSKSGTPLQVVGARSAIAGD